MFGLKNADGALRNVLFAVVGVPDGVTAALARTELLAKAGDDCVEFGRAALGPGLVVGVA